MTLLCLCDLQEEQRERGKNNPVTTGRESITKNIGVSAQGSPDDSHLQVPEGPGGRPPRLHGEHRNRQEATEPAPSSPSPGASPQTWSIRRHASQTTLSAGLAGPGGVPGAYRGFLAVPAALAVGLLLNWAQQGHYQV